MTDTMALLTLEDVADRLMIDSGNRTRKVRDLLTKHDIPVIKPHYRSVFVTEDSYAALLEAMTCRSTSQKGAKSGTSEERSKSGRKRGRSRGTLQDYAAKQLQKNTSRDTQPASKTSSFTVLQGGQST